MLISCYDIVMNVL